MDMQQYEAAWAVAAHFIGYAARSRSEVERRLERAEYAPEIIEAVLSELATRGWLDDTQFARNWVQDRADRKKYGKSRLAAELRRKGVDRAAVDEALEEPGPRRRKDPRSRIGPHPLATGDPVRRRCRNRSGRKTQINQLFTAKGLFVGHNSRGIRGTHGE